MSALTRMAAGSFKQVKLKENDLIVFSASPIPGNEKAVYGLINSLYKLGADVIYDELADVHVSGHACQEEIKLIHSLVKPTFLVPVHGEYRHLRMHKQLAMTLGMDGRNIHLPSLGMQLELGEKSLKEVGFVTAGQRLVDGMGIGDMDSNVLKERLQLSEEGVCVGVVKLNTITGEIENEPFIITRGVVYQTETDEFTKAAKDCIVASLKEQDIRGVDPSVVRTTLKRTLSNFIFKRTKRRPMVLIIVT